MPGYHQRIVDCYGGGDEDGGEEEIGGDRRC